MVEVALSKDDPRMIAWAAYTRTDEFENTKRWASFPEHSNGSLWAAFLAGWTAAHATPADHGELGDKRGG